MTKTVAHKNYRLIHDIYVLLDAVDHDLLRYFNLTNSQYRVLSLLAEDHGDHLITLSHRMLCARSTVTRLVDQMEAAQLVSREIDPDDRRAHRVALTPLGEEIYHRARAAHEESLQERFTLLSSVELDQLEALLHKVRSNLELKLHS